MDRTGNASDVLDQVFLRHGLTGNHVKILIGSPAKIPGCQHVVPVHTAQEKTVPILGQGIPVSGCPLSNAIQALLTFLVPSGSWDSTFLEPVAVTALTFFDP